MATTSTEDIDARFKEAFAEWKREKFRKDMEEMKMMLKRILTRENILVAKSREEKEPTDSRRPLELLPFSGVLTKLEEKEEPSSQMNSIGEQEEPEELSFVNKEKQQDNTILLFDTERAKTKEHEYFLHEGEEKTEAIQMGMSSLLAKAGDDAFSEKDTAHGDFSASSTAKESLKNARRFSPMAAAENDGKTKNSWILDRVKKTGWGRSPIGWVGKPNGQARLYGLYSRKNKAGLAQYFICCMLNKSNHYFRLTQVFGPKSTYPTRSSPTGSSTKTHRSADEKLSLITMTASFAMGEGKNVEGSPTASQATRERIMSDEHVGKRSIGHEQKPEIRIFTGEDTKGWILRVERYFTENRWLDEEKVDAISCCFLIIFVPSFILDPPFFALWLTWISINKAEVHGDIGEDSTLQSLLDAGGVPYTGRSHLAKGHGGSDTIMARKGPATTPNHKHSQVDDCAYHSTDELCSKPHSHLRNQDRRPLEKQYVRVDLSFLKTLGQVHSGWIFGGIAEFFDNSRDDKATKLDNFIDKIKLKSGSDEPILTVINDGHGKKYKEIMKMVSIGHKQSDDNDPDRTGRFGVGFKTGAMKLGSDALVLTQTANSRCVAFLSHLLNEGKENIEIPIVYYHCLGQPMEVDMSVQTEASVEYNFKAIKKISLFNGNLIGYKRVGGMIHKSDVRDVWLNPLESQDQAPIGKNSLFPTLNSHLEGKVKLRGPANVGLVVLNQYRRRDEPRDKDKSTIIIIDEEDSLLATGSLTEVTPLNCVFLVSILRIRLVMEMYVGAIQICKSCLLGKQPPVSTSNSHLEGKVKLRGRSNVGPVVLKKGIKREGRVTKSMTAG